MISFEFEHFYPGFEQQKFWDFLVDYQWQSESDIMIGETTLLEPGEGHPMGLGAVRKITISKHNIELIEDIVRSDAPNHLSYAVRDGGSGMPVKGYRGDFIMSSRDGGMELKYLGEFEPKLFGTNWLFKYIFRWRMRTMVPVWEKGYKAYCNKKNQHGS